MNKTMQHVYFSCSTLSVLKNSTKKYSQKSFCRLTLTEFKRHPPPKNYDKNYRNMTFSPLDYAKICHQNLDFIYFLVASKPIFSNNTNKSISTPPRFFAKSQYLSTFKDQTVCLLECQSTHSNAYFHFGTLLRLKYSFQENIVYSQ